MDIVTAFAGGLFLIVISLVGFIATRFIRSQESIRAELGELRKDLVHELTSLGKTLRAIETDLRKELSALDRRVIQVEEQHRAHQVAGHD